MESPKLINHDQPSAAVIKHHLNHSPQQLIPAKQQLNRSTRGQFRPIPKKPSGLTNSVYFSRSHVCQQSIKFPRTVSTIEVQSCMKRKHGPIRADINYRYKHRGEDLSALNQL